MKNMLSESFHGPDWSSTRFASRSRAIMYMTKNVTRLLAIAATFALAAGCVLSAGLVAAQSTTSTYQPKFAGDPAHSDSEAAALAYMRVVIRAEHRFNKQYGHYATTLAELVHSGSFTKRMVNPDRGDYTAEFKGKKDSFVLSMMPQHLDSDHRSFYAEDDGKIHADDAKSANAESPVVK